MIQALLIDLEGTIYTSEGMIEGSQSAIERLRNDGHVIRFLTNTDSRSSESILRDLSNMGLHLHEHELFTPVSAAGVMLSSMTGVRVLALTNDSLRRQLESDLTVVDPGTHASVTHVVVGDIRDCLSYPLLDSAFTALTKGAKLIALQKGRYFLSEGQPHLDTGAIVAALEYAAETNAEVVGKPSNSFFEMAIKPLELDISFERVWVIGDDRSTDIAMGHQSGVRTVQVRTGKYLDQRDREDLVRPDYVIDSIADLPALVATNKR
ncbi:MAG: HAD-IIA family hydrolase [Ferrimicrobium sp.]